MYALINQYILSKHIDKPENSCYNVNMNKTARFLRKRVNLMNKKLILFSAICFIAGIAAISLTLSFIRPIMVAATASVFTPDIGSTYENYGQNYIVIAKTNDNLPVVYDEDTNVLYIMEHGTRIAQFVFEIVQDSDGNPVKYNGESPEDILKLINNEQI